MNLIELLTQDTGQALEAHRIYGVVVGIVTNNQDPDKLGRVKVRFPWLSAEDESYWARIASLMAGKDRGTFFLPEVDDEVLVAFEQGDVRFPYVVGTLWNGSDTPPYDNSDGTNDLRVFKSRSGHELIFNDNANQARVEVHTQAGHQILLDDASGQEQISIKDKSGNNMIQIDSAQNAITISSQMQLNLKAQMITIEAGSMLNIKAGATLKIEGALVQIN